MHHLIQKRRRKYQRKQDLARIKAQWALFQQISPDTKDLDDIPRYGAQAQLLQLPLIQYTAREVRSGLLFWASPGEAGIHARQSGAKKARATSQRLALE